MTRALLFLLCLLAMLPAHARLSALGGNRSEEHTSELQSQR